jgi:hypothetical protein
MYLGCNRDLTDNQCTWYITLIKHCSKNCNLETKIFDLEQMQTTKRSCKVEGKYNKTYIESVMFKVW